MKTMLLAVGLTGVLAFAQEKTIEVPREKAETYTPQTKDPQQSRNEQTTQIVTNTSKGTAPANYKGSNTVDEDLRQRVTVALSTGSVGTQGVLPSDLLTDIKVSVTNRVVTLKGDVMSEDRRKTLAKRVAGLDGVKSVNNQLTVNPKTKKNHADILKPDGYGPGKKDDRTQDGGRVEDLNKK
jgi:osmotically-inducible protein OsmY